MKLKVGNNTIYDRTIWFDESVEYTFMYSRTKYCNDKHCMLYAKGLDYDVLVSLNQIVYKFVP